MQLACRGAPGRRGLAELRRLLTLPPREWNALLQAMMADTDAAGGLVARAAARQLGKADREAAGVLSSAQRHTHMLDSPRLLATMGRSDFRFADLRKGTATVFLVPEENCEEAVAAHVGGLQLVKIPEAGGLDAAYGDLQRLARGDTALPSC